MLLADLRVLHQPKKVTRHSPGMTPLPNPSRTFFIETCQRKLWIFPVSSGNITGINLSEFELLSGPDAYRLLLEVSTGLASQVRGEADVFGQVKEAWSKFEKADSTDSETLQSLRPWAQKWFEDTKEIRTRYLQNIGGASYGSLVRMLFKEQADPSSEPILLVGAGQLAQSILPWLDDHELWLVNRSVSGLEAMTLELAKRGRTHYRIFVGREQEQFAFEYAAHAVLCIPMNSRVDPDRVRWLQSGRAQGTAPSTQKVVHLGGMSTQGTPWAHLPGVVSLGQLFELQTQQSQKREDVFTSAERACWEKARLRHLSSPFGGSLSVPHGWEDLAVFTRIG